jgi:predicted small lipoprotein YifL
MIKKIILVMLLSTMLISCGKKGCPKNSPEEKCNELFKQN